LAAKNHAIALSLLPWWDGEDNQKEKAKLRGCVKNSLTGQQSEKKVTMIVLIKRIYGMQCSHHPVFRLFLSSKSPSFSQLSTYILSITSHGIEYPI